MLNARKAEVDVKLRSDLILAKLNAPPEETGPTFAEQREEARDIELQQREEDTAFFEKQEEERKERELEELKFKEEYFALIREKKYEEAADLLNAFGRI